MRGWWASLLLMIHFFSKAQFYTLPNQWMFQQIQDYHLLKSDTTLPTNIYPRNPFIYQKFSDIDTNYHLFKYIKNDPALDILFEKDAVSIRKKEFSIRINPLLNFQKGRQTADTSISAYTNTRGFIASATIDNVYIETLLSENQSVFPHYLYDYSKATQVVPGQGRWKTFKTSGFDYAFSAGLVSVQASKNVNISVGTGKQKIGNGYRSLFLSDNAFVYPFVKIEQLWWKGRMQYLCNYAMLNNLTSASARIPANTERLFQKKPFVYQYLNIGIFKHTRIGFFQGVIGESADRRNVWRGDGILFSPVIFSQWLYYGMDNKNNVILGMDIQQKILKTLMIYGQWMIDGNEIRIHNTASYGYQIGFKYLNKWNDWQVLFLSEWNDVYGGSYLSPIYDNFSNSSYAHFNQNLAYTPETGNEWLVLLSLKKKRWLLSGQWNYQQKNNLTYNIAYYKGIVGFVLNPSYNLILNMGVENRKTDKTNNYIYLQLQTSLYNIYYDF